MITYPSPIMGVEMERTKLDQWFTDRDNKSRSLATSLTLFWSPSPSPANFIRTTPVAKITKEAITSTVKIRYRQNKVPPK